jgi:hypothetical protein
MSETGGSVGGQVKEKRGAGGTPGGVGEFFLGLLLAGIGSYLLLQHVTVTTSFWRLWGTQNSFGLSLLPMLFGVGILFFKGKSVLGWVLTAGGFLFIVVGIIMNMDIYFQRTSLFNTLVMLVLIAGGLGLILRSLRPH